MIKDSRLLMRGLLAIVLGVAAGTWARDVMPPSIAVANSAANALAGVWLAESADMGAQSELAFVWKSKFTVTGDSFALSKFRGVSKDLRGRLTVDPAASPKSIDLIVDEFDLSDTGHSVKYSACTLPGIYRVDGDRLSVCFPTGSDPRRPIDFHPNDKNTVVLTLVRADADFRDFPKEVTVTVKDANGTPVAHASVFSFMSLWHGGQKAGTEPKWKYGEIARTGADGTARVPYDELSSCPAAARDENRKLIGFTAISPASLAKGSVVVQLQPECHLSGTIVCDQLEKDRKPVGWTNAYLIQNGRRIAECDSRTGTFEFRLPPGAYTLNAYGSNLRGKNVPVVVPAGQAEYQAKPISLSASRLVMLQDHPAPEPAGIIGWKGRSVKLADLRGKFVLLNFWGYWCGPCVHEMPMLIDLHEKFGDKNLAIIGVHRDLDGEVDTAVKLDEKIARYRTELWSGRDLPFPIVLISGKENRSGRDDPLSDAAAQYGILGYPTTILIDRQGNVVGEFEATDTKDAIAKVQKLLDQR